MQEDIGTNANSPIRRTALISVRFESLCLKLLFGFSIVLVFIAVFANEHFPAFEEQVRTLLNWPIVDLDSLRGTAWFAGYRWLNRIEGLVWIAFGALSCRRFVRFHKSGVEPVYAVAFLVFGVSDFIEALQYPAWLGIWKIYNLAVLLYCRSYLLRVHYLNSNVY